MVNSYPFFVTCSNSRYVFVFCLFVLFVCLSVCLSLSLSFCAEYLLPYNISLRLTKVNFFVCA